MMTEFEAGVRELVARLRDFERRMKKTEDDAGALEQLVKLIRPGLGWDTVAVNTTFSGVVQSNCNSGGLVADVTLTPSSGGSPLIVVTSDAAGNYSGTITLASNANIDLLYHHANARFVDSTDAAHPFTAGAANALGTRLMTAATGYHCVALCAFPIKDTLICADSKRGVNVTMTYNGASNLWAGVSGGLSYQLTAAGLFTVTGLGGYGVMNFVSSACAPSVVQLVFDKASVPVTCTITEAP
jgi:hypothetical protein